MPYSVNAVFIGSGGGGYSTNDVLTVSGGTFSVAATLTVTSQLIGAITGLAVNNAGVYTIIPGNPVSLTGGTGTLATALLAWVDSSVVSDNLGGNEAGLVSLPSSTLGVDGLGGRESFGDADTHLVLITDSLAGSDLLVRLVTAKRLMTELSGTMEVILPTGTVGIGGAFPQRRTKTTIQPARKLKSLPAWSFFYYDPTREY